MAKLKESDFYYGAVLSMLLNNKICPALVESGKDRQVYEFTTDQGDFKLFLKYRSAPTTKNEDIYRSWQFNFTESDLKELHQYIEEEKHLSVGLVCGESELGKSLYAVLHKEELCSLLEAGKTSLTISFKKSEKSKKSKKRKKCFRIPVGGGRDNDMQIPADRKF